MVTGEWTDPHRGKVKLGEYARYGLLSARTCGPPIRR